MEIETNGTFIPSYDLVAAMTGLNVSPKLSSAGGRESTRIVPAALERLARCGKSRFKFVVSDRADFAEITDLASRFRMVDVWVMPAGTKADTVVHGMRNLADEVLSRGRNLSSRMHVLWWGGRTAGDRGTTTPEWGRRSPSPQPRVWDSGVSRGGGIVPATQAGSTVSANSLHSTVHSLMPFLIDPKHLKRAARACMRRASAPGADGESWASFRTALDTRLEGLATSLREESWRPGPLKQSHVITYTGKRIETVIPTVSEAVVFPGAIGVFTLVADRYVRPMGVVACQVAVPREVSNAVSRWTTGTARACCSASGRWPA
ncbi:hypothetical protein ACFWMU_23650 [Streptomyces sp. NPDC058357]|uniref:hypothetical protein n=1 Tax=unclassified Streptomyces TaxID=2593676 RepID=UPI00364B20E8